MNRSDLKRHEINFSYHATAHSLFHAGVCRKECDLSSISETRTERGMQKRSYQDEFGCGKASFSGGSGNVKSPGFVHWLNQHLASIDPDHKAFHIPQSR